MSRVTAYFHTTPQLATGAQPFDVDGMMTELNVQMENWNGRGSGFTLERVTRFVLCINTYRPLQGSTYIKTPEWLLNKRCVVNVENKNDSKCFVWSVLAALYTPKHNPNRLMHYTPYLTNLNLEGLEFPMTTKLIPRLENNNPTISINVLYSVPDGFTVEYLSPHRDREHHVNLLLLDDDENPAKHHYVYIKNMSALVCHRTKHEKNARV